MAKKKQKDTTTAQAEDPNVAVELAAAESEIDEVVPTSGTETPILEDTDAGTTMGSDGGESIISDVPDSLDPVVDLDDDWDSDDNDDDLLVADEDVSDEDASDEEDVETIEIEEDSPLANILGTVREDEEIARAELELYNANSARSENMMSSLVNSMAAFGIKETTAVAFTKHRLIRPPKSKKKGKKGKKRKAKIVYDTFVLLCPAVYFGTGVGLCVYDDETNTLRALDYAAPVDQGIISSTYEWLTDPEVEMREKEGVVDLSKVVDEETTVSVTFMGGEAPMVLTYDRIVLGEHLPDPEVYFADLPSDVEDEDEDEESTINIGSLLYSIGSELTKTRAKAVADGNVKDETVGAVLAMMEHLGVEDLDVFVEEYEEEEDEEEEDEE